MTDILTLIAAYLLGSVPFGLMLYKAAGHGDIRRIGSGNIGATNVMRSGRKGLAAATLLCDALKGAAAVGLALHLAPQIAPGAALTAVAGHIFPVWLKFKGGKGVATSLGVWLALSPPVGLSLMAVWLAAFALWRISSLSALTAFAVSPVAAYALAGPVEGAVALIIALLVFQAHRSNIKRLLAGEEGSRGAPRP